MVKNFTQAITVLALLILIPTTDVAHASCSDNSNCEEKEVEEVIVIGQRERRAVTPVGGGGCGNEAPAPNDYGQGRGGGSAGRLGTAGPAEKGQKVMDCAKKADATGNVFAKVRAKGRVVVSYSAERMFHQGSRVHGETKWKGGRAEITMYYQNNADAARDRGVSFWPVFAEVLLHEHHHALDMINCGCNNPDESVRMTPIAYELATAAKAAADYARLFSGKESCFTD